MTKTIATAIGALSLGLGAPMAMAHDTGAPTETTEPRAAATVADLAWLEGHWAGTGIGGNPAGETFSYAGEGQMVGHFWQADSEGGIQFYELITVTPDGDSLMMRLKHFTADLTGWEEKPGDTALEFPLRERSDTRWVFGPVTFTRPAPDRLDVSVRMRPRDDGTAQSLDFTYNRVSPAPRP